MQGTGKAISGRQVLLALLGIGLVTALLPPAAAWELNHRRITETRSRIEIAQARVLLGVVRMRDAEPHIAVARGPGRVPAARPDVPSAVHELWTTGVAPAPEVFGDDMPADAWGHCFLVNLDGASLGGVSWLLSAGPNGVIETSLDATQLGGDDIGVALR